MIAHGVGQSGRVEEIEADPAEQTIQARGEVVKFQCRIMRWTPPSDIRGEFHPDFSIDFAVTISEDGTRRFAPHTQYDRFIYYAFFAGLCLRGRDRRLSREQLAEYRLMWFIFDRVRGMQEHLDRSFHFSRDLHVRQGGRLVDDERSVFPEHLGLDTRGQGRSWTTSMLREEGESRAREHGIEQPNTQQQIAWGLLAAAERNPLFISDSEVKSLVRAALFESPDASVATSTELLHDIYNSIADHFNGHRLDSNDAFDRWFAGKKSNVFKSLGGRSYTTLEVRRAVLELGWDAYHKVAECISDFIEAFARVLPVPLSDEETALLQNAFQPKDYLGGLPVILMMERKHLLGPLIARLWSSPGDSEVVGVLHRLLDYYATLARNRREVDRRTKRNPGRLTLSGTAIATSTAAKPASSASEQLESILALYVARNSLRCEECGLPMKAGVGESAEFSIQRGAKIELWCREHPKRRTVHVPFAELRLVEKDVI